MRILLVTPWYAPAYAYGGIVRVTEDHASGLAQRGHDVTVITTDAHNRDSRNPTREDTINGVRVIRFPNISNFLANRSNIYSPIGFDRWTRENISEFDRVIVHDIYTWLTFRALHHANKSGIPYAIMPHGTMSHARVTLRHSHIKQWLLEKIRPYLRDAFAVYAISDGEHDDILSVESRARTVTLGNGIDMDAIPIIDRPAARTNLGISTSTFVCMFLGRLHPLKHPDIAIRAFTRFHETHPDSILLIVGPDDGARESAQSLARTL
ncbi:MAG TPA: glycosyltransferase [bacterium]|nr:glycosyltransferase [bacterium]